MLTDITLDAQRVEGSAIKWASTIIRLNGMLWRRWRLLVMEPPYLKVQAGENQKLNFSTLAGTLQLSGKFGTALTLLKQRNDLRAGPTGRPQRTGTARSLVLMINRGPAP